MELLRERGEVEMTGRAAPRLAFHGDATTVAAEDAVNHGQPQPGALTRCLRREERLEDAPKGDGIHAFPGVANRQADVRPGAKFRVRLAKAGLQLTGFKPHLDATDLTFHRMPGIRGEVEDDLVDLGSIGLDRWHCWRRLESESNTGGKGRAEQSDDLVKNRLKLGWLELLLLGPAEGQDALHQFLGPLAGAEDLIDAHQR